MAEQRAGRSIVNIADTADVAETKEQRLRLSGGAISALIGVGLLAIFMIQNTQRVTLHFLFWSFTWPLWLLTLATALIGALVWFGLGVVRRHQRRKARREDRRN